MVSTLRASLQSPQDPSKSGLQSNGTDKLVRLKGLADSSLRMLVGLALGNGIGKMSRKENATQVRFHDTPRALIDRSLTCDILSSHYILQS